MPNKNNRRVRGYLTSLGILGVSGTLIIVSTSLYFFITSKIKEHNAKIQRQDQKTIELSLKYQNDGKCLELPRSNAIKLSNYQTLEIPLSENLAVLLLISDEENTTRSYIITNGDNGWSGSETLSTYKIIQENGERILSFAHSIHNTEESQSLLIVSIPKNIAHNLKIQPFNNQDLTKINALNVYRVKNVNGAIISPFQELLAIKNVGQSISPDLEKLINENIFMGQLIIPDYLQMRERVLNATIKDVPQCTNIQ